jgi:hypothetical protein
VIKIAASFAISEHQLRAQGVLKPRLPDPHPRASAEQLSAQWRVVEQFLETLRSLTPNRA